MCGIAGLVQPGRVPDQRVVQRMAERLRHRGPDDHGCHVGPDVGFGFRRLSIIDLENGNQPVRNGAGTVHAVFNGEIYNFRELRAELEAAGHSFRTQGDAEVLPHLYEEHGPDMVRMLRGMFAFAIWDAERRELLLARDRVGEKPLYYSTAPPGGGLAFGSEIKALLEAGVSRDPDPRSIIEYLRCLYVPAPRSGFAAIAKLPPGHLLRYRKGHVSLSRYWTPTFDVLDRTDECHVQGVREHVLDAVSSRLIADVPIGAFLSGGIDSTTVVAAMTQVHDGPIHTFTIAFEGFEHYDEAAAARETARHFGTHHHELGASVDFAAMMPSLVEGFDEPFGNPTAALVSSLSAVTREHVKVVLTGDGADELFFGYPRYRGLQVARGYRRATVAPIRSLLALASRALPEDTAGRHAARRIREFLEAGNLGSRAAYSSWIGYFNEEMLSELLLGDAAAQASTASEFLDGLFGDNGDPDLNDISRIELQSFLPYNVLEYADKMSMAHGLELRAPFVDHELIDFVGSLPPHLKLRGGTSKWALRRAFGSEFPPSVLRRKKLGLNPPLGAWFSNGAAPLVRDLLSPSAVRRRGLFRPEAVGRLLREQEMGRRDRSLHIWALLVLELWFRLRVDPA